jgi:hypothetical protein
MKKQRAMNLRLFELRILLNSIIKEFRYIKSTFYSYKFIRGKPCFIRGKTP